VRHVIVVGSGLAGLSAAVSAAGCGAKVTLLTAGEAPSGSSVLAQGGVAAAAAADDSPELHKADTLLVGGGLCDLQAVTTLVQAGQRTVERLLSDGAPFEMSGGRPVLALEAGHSRRRVLHAGAGESGRVLTSWLFDRLPMHESVDVAGHVPIDGILVEEGRARGVRSRGREVRADAVVLATGGYAALWARTTNDASNQGTGLAIAWRAGASLADLEMVQFHPTALDLPGQRAFLLSEALRGEGAQVVDREGNVIADPLLPRDVLAREIHRFRQREGHVYLSLRHLDPTFVDARFASLAAPLRAWGLELARDLIPVAPAAHYCMGGIRTDRDGRTTLPGLYAAGEVACTGVHGANRLASNSLLECLVFGERAGGAAALDGQAAAASWTLAPLPEAADLPAAAAPMTAAAAAVPDLLDRYVGVERSGRALLELMHALGGAEMAENPLPSLIAQAALCRRESRGAHYRNDASDARPLWQGRIHWRYGAAPAFEPVLDS